MPTKNNNPIVSICCTVYNHEKFLEDTFNGFLSQEVDFPIEIVINEDCSSDSSAEIIRKYEQLYPHIVKPVYQSVNQYSLGKKPLTQLVLPRAKGKYIAICEGDDYWTDPKKLQIQVDEMEKRPECQMSFHPAQKLNQQTGELFTISRHHKENKIIDPKNIIKADGGYCPTASLMFRKKIIDNLPDLVYDAPVGDYFLQVLGSIADGALYIDRVMSVYRTETGIGWKDRLDNLDRKKIFVDNYITSIEELNEYLKFVFCDSFMYLKSKIYLRYAIQFLKGRRIDDFRSHIEKSYALFQLKTIELSLLYHLRYFPRFLMLVCRIKNYFIKN
ncbi:glycosyltransferase [uncultured Draconibacterium sp.]|uniref:glycosyltransferase n=1 Tax=uncultured Draconibacterium sp. TaxID=1573823 RepID=UPI002AA649F4|nr:glycosyltransferase [uncultured Draconibacterium sp.]